MSGRCVRLADEMKRQVALKAMVTALREPCAEAENRAAIPQGSGKKGLVASYLQSPER